MRVCPRCTQQFPSSERFCPGDGAVLVDESDVSRIGTTIGSYLLQDVIGRGGMGTVYSGEHIYIRKRVAVKVLHARFARYEEAMERFLSEARAASSIQHPNIVDVTDFGPMPEGGVYFVMEYLEGTSLEDQIEAEGHLPLHRALNIANQICLALAAAHEKLIVHRDLKPENIMLIPRPGRRAVVRKVSRDENPAGYVTEREDAYDFVKILDFGVAKVHAPEQSTPQTMKGAIFGTPEYMSPEAARGEDVDHRADIYSVGVILFDMLTGRPPFEAEAAAEVLSMQIHKPPPSPCAVAPHNEITAACEQLVLKALAKNPDDRHQSMDEFREELQRCYGSIAYRRHATSVPGMAPIGEEARGSGAGEERGAGAIETEKAGEERGAGAIEAEEAEVARRPRLTEELDDWFHSDGTRISLEQARTLAMTVQMDGAPVEERELTPDEEERLAAALDAALGDDRDD